MNNQNIIQTYFQAVSIAFLLVFTGYSCSTSASTPISQITQVKKVVPIQVTQDITREVTLVIKVPVTVTPSETSQLTSDPSLTQTITDIPTFIPTPKPPEVAILKHADCLYGPGFMYLYKFSIAAGSLMEVVGRNFDGSWLYVQEVGGWNPCWIFTSLAQFSKGDAKGVPFITSRLPFSYFHTIPDATAHRKGSEVTISWKAIWMSFDDFRGYLIEAWVCQGGELVFVPIGFIPPLADNAGILTQKVTDEPGCHAPSNVLIYAVHKQGYSQGGNIPWPQAQ
jgi:hypothetical protein